MRTVAARLTGDLKSAASALRTLAMRMCAHLSVIRNASVSIRFPHRTLPPAFLFLSPTMSKSRRISWQPRLAAAFLTLFRKRPSIWDACTGCQDFFQISRATRPGVERPQSPRTPSPRSPDRGGLYDRSAAACQVGILSFLPLGRSGSNATLQPTPLDRPAHFRCHQQHTTGAAGDRGPVHAADTSHHCRRETHCQGTRAFTQKQNPSPLFPARDGIVG